VVLARGPKRVVLPALIHREQVTFLGEKLE
jgi:hypothetical protein